MREIITIEVGQAGIQVGNAAWEQYCGEHNISNEGRQHRVTKDNSLKVFFEEASDGQFVPRNLAVDLEPSVIDKVKSGPLGSLFNSNFLLSGNEDACTHARGFYSTGRQIIDEVTDKLRKLVDNCDNVMGFIITNSIGGGTGSGMCMLILERLYVDYKKKAKVGCVIYPSKTLSTLIVEPYNAMLAMHWLVDHVDIALAFDNESLYNICQRNLHIAKPDMSNVNRLIAKVISSMTASIRFSGELNANLDELRMNL
ncbi:hypothetical protein RFI_35571, partial [Reticulomyxa filosa]